MPLLTQALTGHRTAAAERIAERYERVKAIHDQQRIAWRDALEAVRGESPIDPRWVSHCIDAVKMVDALRFGRRHSGGLGLGEPGFPDPGSCSP
ncbi:MAG: hypothetical protein RBT16_03130 [Desulfococcus multivorans]|jgi:acetolactate synthase-1/2/3 large subunit|nr:hypothetical protein [Desulfococcus multivorans]